MSTGNEIVDAGAPLGPGQIYDVNRYTLDAVVRRHGGVAAARADRRRYSLDELVRALDAATAHDIIVSPAAARSAIAT